MAKAITNYPPEFESGLREYLDYDPETGILRWKKSKSPTAREGNIAGCSGGSGHLRIHFMDRGMLVHRICWFLYHGYWAEEIDHWDGVNTNNAINNLRDVDRRTNQENRRRAQKNSSTGLLGVRKSGKRCLKPFMSIIKVDGNPIHLGLFDTAEEAHGAYLEAKRILHKGCTI